MGRITKQILGRINIYQLEFLQDSINNLFIREQKKGKKGERDKIEKKIEGGRRWSYNRNIFRTSRMFNKSMLQFTLRHRKFNTVYTSQNSGAASSEGMEQINNVFPVILGLQLISCWALRKSFRSLGDSWCCLACLTDFESREWKA